MRCFLIPNNLQNVKHTLLTSVFATIGTNMTLIEMLTQTNDTNMVSFLCILTSLKMQICKFHKNSILLAKVQT